MTNKIHFAPTTSSLHRDSHGQSLTDQPDQSFDVQHDKDNESLYRKFPNLPQVHGGLKLKANCPAWVYEVIKDIQVVGNFIGDIKMPDCTMKNKLPHFKSALEDEHVDISPRLAYTKQLIRKGVQDGSLKAAFQHAHEKRAQVVVHKQEFRVRKLDIAYLVGLNAILVYGVTMIQW